MGGEAGQGGDTAEQPAYPGQPGAWGTVSSPTPPGAQPVTAAWWPVGSAAYFDASLEAAGLYEVGSNETGGDAGPVAHGGDKVELLPGHLQPG